MKLLAYHKWLKMQTTDKEKLSFVILNEVLNGNEMAYDLLEETGDKTYNMDTFKKAADLILNGKE